MNVTMIRARSLWLIAALWLGLVENQPVESFADFAELVEKHGAAIVNISTTQTRQQAAFKLPGVPENSPYYEYFKRFFGEEGGQQAPEREYHSQSLGSGFIVSSDGYLITNHHVLVGKYSAEVRTYDGKTYPIKHVAAVNPAADLIKVSVDIPANSIWPSNGSQTSLHNWKSWPSAEPLLAMV